MCGIVGCTGKKNCVPVLMDGLKKLEYRGYDSVGIAVIDSTNDLQIIKKQGRVATLEKYIEGVSGKCGIGHTRWATHGKPSDKNSHPHACGNFAVVHNGIIENFLELKLELLSQGEIFNSDTDTEIIAHLIKLNYKGSFIEAVRDTVKMLAGSYALAVISNKYPDVIIVAKKDNPLIIGKGNGVNYIASDAPALAKYTKDVYVMSDGDLAMLTPAEIKFYDENLNETEKKFKKLDMVESSLELGNYESFMMKEIHEIPTAIENTLESLDGNVYPPEFIEKMLNAPAVTVVACGTAYHAGLCGQYLLEKFNRLTVNIAVASEYRYRNPIIKDGEVIIAVSQSGETADTIAAVKLAKERGAYVCSITNVAQSSITTYSDCVIHTKAGPEIAVAATKSYNCQLIAFYYMSMLLLKAQGKDVKTFDKTLRSLPSLAESVIDKAKNIREFAGKFSHVQDMFFLGRNLDYAVALEGSLKLKEISYIHSEGCPAGELKHGTLALIEKNTLVIVIITRRELAEKTMNGIHEVKARGATVLAVTPFEDVATSDGIDEAILIPETDNDFEPVLSVIPLQIFAYYIARARGNDPDKPRNLAKSVTVE